MLERDVKKIEMEVSFFDYCFKKKIKNITINKTTITEENGYLVIKKKMEDPFILFKIYLAYKSLNDDAYIDIRIKKNLFKYIGKNKIRIKINSGEEGVLKMVPNLVINNESLTEVN
jgi:hypothetical protein